MLFPIIGAYEESGNGGDQRVEDTNNWGKTNLTEASTMDGDDRANFLTAGGKHPENVRHYYVLYFWHLLEQQGLLQFALAKLPNHMKANSEQYSLVASSKNNRSVDNKARLATSVEKVASGINAFAETMKQNVYDEKRTQKEKKLDKYDEPIFELEMKLENLKKGH